MIIVEAYMHPYASRPIMASVDPCQTIYEITGRKDVLAWINGHEVPEALITTARIKDGQRVTVCVKPHGGGLLRAVLTIGVAVAAATIPGAQIFGLTAGNIGFALFSAGISIAGTLLINALIPPAKPSNQDSASFNRRDSLTGASNQIGSFVPISRVYGTFRFFPTIPMTALPFTEIVGDDQFLRMMVVLGYGPLQIGGQRAGDGSLITHQTALSGSPIKIGETDISEFSDVEFEIGDASAMTLYSNQIIESSPQFSTATNISGIGGGAGGQFVPNGASAIRTTDDNIDEISVSVEYPGGIFSINSRGARTFAESIWSVEYSPTGSGIWTVVNPAWSQSGPRLETVRDGLRWRVPNGQYDVRMTHVGTTYADFEGSAEIPVSWISLRSIRSTKRAFDEDGVVVMALRIRSTSQLNGVLRDLSVEATSLLKAWNGSAWVEQATGNPAWIYSDIVSGTANMRPLSRDRLDTAELLQWANDASTQGRSYNGIFDSSSTVLDAMREVAANGRASWSMSSEGKIGVVRERGPEIPRLIVSPRNSFDFSFEVLFNKLPHAFRVQYTDGITFDQTERIVYDDGFNASNATEFEILQTRGVTSADQAWKDGRFHFAQARLRRLIYRFSQDVQHVIYRRGDTLTLAYDVILSSLAWGRVKSVVLDGLGDVVKITADQFLTMEPGKSYAVRLQKNDGSIVVAPVVLSVPGSNTVDLVAPVTGIVKGNHFTFGTSGKESTDVKVTKIEPFGDFKAKITCLPAAPAILDAETGIIPPAENFISILPDINLLPPTIPEISLVRSDESVLVRDTDGSLRIRMLVSTVMPSAPGSGTLLQIRYRDSESNGDYLLSQPAESRQAFANDVLEGRAYEIQARSIRGDLSSAWSPVTTHTVIGKSSPPPDVTSMSIDGVRLSWSHVLVDDLDGYVIRFNFGNNVDWGGAVPLHEGIITSSPFVMTQRPAGQVTIMIKAVDTSGNVSRNSANVITDLGDPQIQNVVESIDVSALGYPGTITNGSVIAGSIVADSLDSFYGNGSVSFYGADADSFYDPSNFADMRYENTALAISSVLVGSNATLVIDFEGVFIDIKYRKGTDVDFTQWPGQIVAENTSYLFSISMIGGMTQPKINVMKFVIDAPDIIEYVNDVVIASTGTIITLTKPFTAVKNVNATLQANASGAETIEVDKTINMQPVARAFDSSHNTVSGASADFIVKGF